MMRARHLGACAVLAALALAACGDDDTASDATSDSTSDATPTAAAGAADTTAAATDASAPGSGDGAWKGRTEGGTELTAEMWVDPASTDLAPFEAYRTAVGAPAVSYVRIVADNSGGSAPDTGRFLTFTDAAGDLFAGTAITSDFLCSVLSTRWAPPGGASAEILEEYSALLTGPCADQVGQVPIPAGETVTYHVAVVGEPPVFERVFAGIGNELTRA